MTHKLESVFYDNKGKKCNVVSTRMKFESYNFFHKRHDLKVKAKRYGLLK